MHSPFAEERNEINQERSVSLSHWQEKLDLQPHPHHTSNPVGGCGSPDVHALKAAVSGLFITVAQSPGEGGLCLACILPTLCQRDLTF